MVTHYSGDCTYMPSGRNSRKYDVIMTSLSGVSGSLDRIHRRGRYYLPPKGLKIVPRGLGKVPHPVWRQAVWRHVGYPRSSSGYFFIRSSTLTLPHTLWGIAPSVGNCALCEELPSRPPFGGANRNQPWMTDRTRPAGCKIALSPACFSTPNNNCPA